MRRLAHRKFPQTRTIHPPKAARLALTIQRAPRQWTAELNKPLSATDPQLADLIHSEKGRQRDSLVLIASENFTSKSVFDALGSVMSNKYSEGYPGERIG